MQTRVEKYRLAVEYYEAKDRGEPFEVEYRPTCSSTWVLAIDLTFVGRGEYRRVPEPVEFWINKYEDGVWGKPKPTKAEAEALLGYSNRPGRTVHMKEVQE